MSKLPNFNEYQYQPVYAGMPIQEYTDVVDATANRYDVAKAAKNKLERYILGIRTADQSGQSQKVLDSAYQSLDNSIGQLAKDAMGNTRWDTAVDAVEQLATKFATDENLNHIQDNYKRYQADLEAKNKMISTGVNPLEFDRPIVDFDQNGKRIEYQNRYAPQLGWAKRAQEIVAQIPASSYQTMDEQDYQKLLAENPEDPRVREYNYLLGTKRISKTELDRVEESLINLAKGDDVLRQATQFMSEDQFRNYIRSAANIRQFEENTIHPIASNFPPSRGSGKDGAGKEQGAISPEMSYVDVGTMDNLLSKDVNAREEFKKRVINGAIDKPVFVSTGDAVTDSRIMQQQEQRYNKEKKALDIKAVEFQKLGEARYKNLMNKTDKTPDEIKEIEQLKKDEKASTDKAKFYRKVGVESTFRADENLRGQKYGNVGILMPQGINPDVAIKAQKLTANSVQGSTLDYVLMDGTKSKDTKSLQQMGEQMFGSGYKFVGAEPTGSTAQTAFVEGGEDFIGGDVVTAKFKKGDDVQSVNIAVRNPMSQKAFADTKILARGFKDVSSMARYSTAFDEYIKAGAKDSEIRIDGTPMQLGLPLQTVLGQDNYALLQKGLLAKGMSQEQVDRTLKTISYKPIRSIGISDGKNQAYVAWESASGGKTLQDTTLTLYNTLLEEKAKQTGKPFTPYKSLKDIKTDSGLYVDFNDVVQYNANNYMRSALLPSAMTESKTSEMAINQRALINF